MTQPAPGEVHWRPLSALASLLIYPSGHLAPQAAFCRDLLAAGEPRLFELTEASLRALEEQPLFELEELYTRTFDLNPVCTLEVGWHLYGEQYERGRFMVRARQMLQDVGQDEGGELPDFLPSLLSALPRLPAGEATDLAAYLLPAVTAMCRSLDEKDHDNPYRALVTAVRLALLDRVPEDAVETLANRYRPRFQPPAGELVQLGSKNRGSGNAQGREP